MLASGSGLARICAQLAVGRQPPPTGQWDETQAQHKPSLGDFSRAAWLLRPLLACAFKSSVTHSPSLVMLNQEIENLLRRQPLVSVKREGRVDADGEGVADVGFSAQLCGLHVVRHGNVDAVLIAADE